MKKILLAATAALIAGGAAIAQTPPPPGVAQGTVPAPMASPSPEARTHVMIMSDRVMTRDEVVKHVGEMFARFDANRDGYVTRDELAAFQQKMMGMAGDMQKRLAEHGIMMGDRGAIFDRLDTNHDGVISRQEFMAGQQAREQRVMIIRNGEGAPPAPGAPGEPGMKMHMHGGMGMGGFGARLFDMADANHDGRVSLAEAQAAALAHFDQADLNHDGKLTPEERRQAHEMMRGQRHPS